MADNTEKLVTLSNLSDHIEEIKRILKQVRAYIDKLVGTKVDKVDGKQLSTNDYTTTEKNKLAGIAAGANNYSHPAYTARTGVPTADAKPGFGGTFQVSQPVSDSQGHITAVNTRNITIPNAAATTSAAGLMSSTDKTKLDGIESGAQKNTVTGIKGNAESSYRTGNVNLTPANIGAAAASHTHAAADISDFTTKVKTLQAADILSAEPTEITTTHTVNGVSVAYQIGELIRVPDSESETGFKFFQLHAINDGKAVWAAVGTGSGGSEDNILISTIYIDQTITDPASMISGDINGAAIQAIRANSHRYLGKYTAENTMTICQLLDTNSNYYHDGSAADLTGAEGDVFVRLPVFYTQATELYSNVWMIRFAFGGRPEGERWMQWGGIDLVGAYEGYVDNSILRSISGVTPTSDITFDNFITFANNRGNGCTLNKMRNINIWAFLTMAKYGTTNSQEAIGANTASYPKTTGLTNALGMQDTTSANGNSGPNNNNGLENYTGDIYEFIGNVESYYGRITITEDNGEQRIIRYKGQDNGWFYGSKILIGDYLDIAFIETSGTSTTGYTDAQWFLDFNSHLRFGGYSNINEGGAFSLRASDMGSANALWGGRLLFTGSIIEEKSPERFKTLTDIII